MEEASERCEGERHNDLLLQRLSDDDDEHVSFECLIFKYTYTPKVSKTRAKK